MSNIEFEPNDIVEIPGSRRYRVTGVFIGTLDHESVVGLVAADKRGLPSAYGRDIPEMFMPYGLLKRCVELRGAKLYREVKP